MNDLGFVVVVLSLTVLIYGSFKVLRLSDYGQPRAAFALQIILAFCVALALGNLVTPDLDHSFQLMLDRIGLEGAVKGFVAGCVFAALMYWFAPKSVKNYLPRTFQIFVTDLVYFALGWWIMGQMIIPAAQWSGRNLFNVNDFAFVFVVALLWLLGYALLRLLRLPVIGGRVLNQAWMIFGSGCAGLAAAYSLTGDLAHSFQEALSPLSSEPYAAVWIVVWMVAGLVSSGLIIYVPIKHYDDRYPRSSDYFWAFALYFALTMWGLMQVAKPIFINAVFAGG